ncbi:hypothetical protein [Hymenobacter sp. DG01]|uniref:hypothetical protein n=1 Tax=Hymenobacter sp. DG01 TaxID=2584940 RepID=UPI001124157F|nr:hypothetical protein [Hymenobacter sp. DG01]
MKKLSAAFLLFLSCQVGSLAQEPDNAAFRTEALTATQKLAAVIALDDARLIPVRRLTQNRLAQEADVRRLYTNDPAMLTAKLRVIGQEYTTQLGTLLTPTQYERYLAVAPGTLPATIASVRMLQPALLAGAPAKPASLPKKAAPKAPQNPTPAGRGKPAAARK